MNCYNGEKFLRPAIDSVFAQTYQDWEIIFWDNASTDKSAEIAKSYGEKVKYYKNEKTSTLAAARNKAFEIAKGEFIAILDVDDLWMPTKLEKQVALMESDQTLGFSYSDTMYFNEKGDIFNVFSSCSPKRGHIFGSLLESVQGYMSSEAIMFRRSILKEFSPIFNEKFHAATDYDLLLRLAYKYKVDYVNEVLSKWRDHSGSSTSVARVEVPTENLILLEDLLKANPDMKTKYDREIKTFDRKQHYLFAHAFWKAGNRRDALEHLRPYLTEPKFLISFILINFISYNFFAKCRNRMRTALAG